MILIVEEWGFKWAQLTMIVLILQSLFQVNTLSLFHSLWPNFIYVETSWNATESADVGLLERITVTTTIFRLG